MVPDKKTKNDIIISIQSQKGGVGKTTVALNVAKLLIKAKYRVIFFDLDVAGTEAKVAKESPFWSSCTHIVSFMVPSEDGKKKVISTNIVELYDAYMQGNAVSNLEWKRMSAKEPASSVLDLARINIISSRMECSRATHSVYQHAPQVLFDEAHAAWFVEMIQEIIKNASVNAGANQAPLAVILDCAPGFSGLGPNIEEWLTDIGPQSAKFLFVSSADQQDILACAYAINRVEKAYLMKLKVAKQVIKVRDELRCNIEMSDVILSKNDEKRFMIRLLEKMEANHGCQERNKLKSGGGHHIWDDLHWYATTPLTEIDSAVANVACSWAMMHNRVPTGLMAEMLKTTYNLIVPATDEKDFASIITRCRKNVEKRSVPYVDNYAVQFVSPHFFKKSKNLNLNDAQHVAGEYSVLHLRKAARFSDGFKFIEYLLRAQMSFQQNMRMLASNSNSKVQIAWHEFSPIWLFMMQLNSSGWKRAIRNPLFEIDEHSIERVCEIYLACKNLYEVSSHADVSWIEEAFLVAYALQCWVEDSAFDFDGGLPSWVISRMGWLSKIVPHYLDRSGIASGWYKTRIEVTHDKMRESLENCGFSKGNNAKSYILNVSNACKNFLSSYNYALSAVDSVRIMHTVAKYSYVDESNVLYQVLAESLFHHVMFVEDVEVNDAVEYLEAAGTQASDPKIMVREFFRVRSMTLMTRCLKPILSTGQLGVLK